MTSPGAAPPSRSGLDDVQSVVTATLQEHVGWRGEIPLESELLADLGLESIVLVAVLLDVADELAVDLATADAGLAALHTVADVVAFLASAHP